MHSTKCLQAPGSVTYGLSWSTKPLRFVKWDRTTTCIQPLHFIGTNRGNMRYCTKRELLWMCWQLLVINLLLSVLTFLLESLGFRKHLRLVLFHGDFRKQHTTVCWPLIYTKSKQTLPAYQNHTPPFQDPAALSLWTAQSNFSFHETPLRMRSWPFTPYHFNSNW